MEWEVIRRHAKALNALHLECPPAVVSEIAFRVHKECEAIYTSYITVKHMYHAARAELEARDIKAEELRAAPVEPVVKDCLTSEPAEVPVTPPTDEALREVFAQCLTSTYVCGRVWSAWGVGTMSEGDFSPASECDEVLDELVNTHKTINAPQVAPVRGLAPPPPADVPMLTDAEFYEILSSKPWADDQFDYERAIEAKVRQKAGVSHD